MRSISFFQPMVPPTTTHNDLEIRFKKDKKSGRNVPYIGKTEALQKVEGKWEAYLAQHVPEIPMRGALRVEMRICWPTEGKHRQGEPKVTKPDNDNTEKVVNDCLQRLGFFKDDSQIADNRTMKMWADPAGIYLKIEEMAWEA